jgi:hypothetical protein
MDGYATLNGQQFEMALLAAIPRLEKYAESLEVENLKVRQEAFDRIWAKRTLVFGPWKEKGCWNRVSEGFGMFGATDAQFKLQPVQKLIKEYKKQLASIDVMNAEPYLIRLKDFNMLMGWAK